MDDQIKMNCCNLIKHNIMNRYSLAECLHWNVRKPQKALSIVATSDSTNSVSSLIDEMTISS